MLPSLPGCSVVAAVMGVEADVGRRRAALLLAHISWWKTVCACISPCAGRPYHGRLNHTAEIPEGPRTAKTPACPGSQGPLQAEEIIANTAP